MKATELLQKQHREIEQLLEQAKSTAPEGRKAVREDLARILVAHTQLEEEIFYPAAQRIAPELTLEAIEEHGLADYELGRLLSAKADSDARDAKIGVLAEVVLLHIHREETELFPKVERALGHEALVDLGAEMEPRFRELVAAGFVRPLDRAIARNTPHLVPARARATAKKPARRAEATTKKAAPKVKRGVRTQRAGAHTQRAGAHQRTTTGARKGRKVQRAGASPRARAAG